MRLGLHAGEVEHVAEAHALPLHVVHPPAGDALEVTREGGGLHRDDVVVRERERLVDEALDLQLVVGRGSRREVAGDGVDAEAADGEERGEAGAVLRDQGADLPLQPVLGLGAEQDADGAEADEAEEQPSPHRSPAFVHHF